MWQFRKIPNPQTRSSFPLDARCSPPALTWNLTIAKKLLSMLWFPSVLHSSPPHLIVSKVPTKFWRGSRHSIRLNSLKVSSSSRFLGYYVRNFCILQTMMTTARSHLGWAPTWSSKQLVYQNEQVSNCLLLALRAPHQRGWSQSSCAAGRVTASTHSWWANVYDQSNVQVGMKSFFANLSYKLISNKIREWYQF